MAGECSLAEAADPLRPVFEALSAASDPVAKFAALKATASGLAIPIRHGLLDYYDVEARLIELAISHELVDEFTLGAVEQMIVTALRAPALSKESTNGQEFEPPSDDGWQPPTKIPDEPRDEALPKPAPLQWLDMSGWDNEPVPERKWAIQDRVPLNQVGLFSGEGGTGKSITELQKDVAHVIGEDWLGSMPEPGPAFYIGAEDDKDEIHVRLAAIAKHYGVTFKELNDGGLHVLCLLGQDATLCHVAGKSGNVETTKLYRQLYEAAGDIKPKNISIDTLSRAFAGNEIDRVQVYAFAMHMQALAMVARGSVTVLSHPSLQGISSGSGISGSTAWHGAFRFRQYLKGIKATDGEQPDGDVRQLVFKKNQYGPTAETIVLRYQRGLFLHEGGISSLDKLAREQKTEEVFLTLLARYEREGRNVSDKPTSPTYAPASFCKEKEANGIRKEDFAAAMRQLFAAGKIHVESYGRPSRPATRLRPGQKLGAD